MQSESKVCPFFLKGNCKFGDKCNNPHQINGSTNNKQGNNNFSNKPNPNYLGNKPNNFSGGHNQGFGNPNSKFGNNHTNKFNPQGPNTNNNNNNNNTNNHYNNNNNNNPMNFNKFENKSFSNNKPKSGPNNICNFFTRPNGCDRGETCKFLHNYHETLHHIKREAIHQANIVGCTTTSK